MKEEELQVIKSAWFAILSKCFKHFMNEETLDLSVNHD
jgi:hypothetical protein